MTSPSQPPRSPRSATPAKRYAIRFTIAVVLYAAGVIGAAALQGVSGEGPLGWWPALLTLPGIVVGVFAVLALNRESDEFERSKQGEALTFAFAVGVPIILVLGLLQSFGFGHIPFLAAGIILLAAWLIGAIVVAIRYR